LNAAGRPREILVDECSIQADRFEDLRAAVALLRRDAHLRHYLEHPLGHRLEELLLEHLGRVIGREVAIDLHLVNCGEGEIRIDRAGAVAGEQGKVLHLAGFARLDHEAAARASFLANEMVVNATRGQQRRNRHPIGIHATVGKDEDRGSLGNRGRGLATQLLHAASEPRGTFAAAE